MYSALGRVPELVETTTDLAERHGFARSCSPEVGRLLRTLAGSVRDGAIAELGTGCGVGSAWIASALRPGVSFVTVDSDRGRVEEVRRLLTGMSRVEVVHSDWRDVLALGPFSLVFADVSAAKLDPGAIVASLVPGGIVLLDDLTPLERWPEEWREKTDPVRDAWLNLDDVVATEVLVTPESAVIIATRIG